MSSDFVVGRETNYCITTAHIDFIVVYMFTTYNGVVMSIPFIRVVASDVLI